VSKLKDFLSIIKFKNINRKLYKIISKNQNRVNFTTNAIINKKFITNKKNMQFDDLLLLLLSTTVFTFCFAFYTCNAASSIFK